MSRTGSTTNILTVSIAMTTTTIIALATCYI